MKIIRLRQRFTDHPPSFIWERISNIKEYPKNIKFVKEVLVDEVRKGAEYTDITTLLWKRVKVHHVIIDIEENKKISYFATLPRGGKMWMYYTIDKKMNYTELYAEIKFDLGNKLSNNTIGYILEKRLIHMLVHVFPEIKDVQRIK